MGFICPDCSQAGLKIRSSIALPADSRSDEIALQTVVCSHCGLRAIAVYEESRRGSLEAESWDHTGYRVSRADFNMLAADLKHCLTPSRASCQCDVHRRWGKTDANGRWQGLSIVSVYIPFGMELSGPLKSP
jgi:hypothetical protein